MNQSHYDQNKQKLRQLMAQAEIPDFKTLIKMSGVSFWQLERLQYGLMYRMSVANLLKLSSVLKVSLDQLVSTFVDSAKYPENWQPQVKQDTSDFWQQEYKILQQQMEHQKDTVQKDLQKASLQTIESWLIQWPTAVAAIVKNPELPAARLLPLIKPVERLVHKWGIKPIASVGEELPYDPQWHELMKGSAEPGEMVKVRYVGYKQQEKILYKVKVSPVSEG
ncbi:MAG: helix-turn-helix domain-containing protein [Xenococcaceae cyanobacterium MO_167.B27]|nr:helix-turn-helix domain-containing protein [Xenococcaceae cyanobacterium MO_167.B27]